MIVRFRFCFIYCYYVPRTAEKPSGDFFLRFGVAIIKLMFYFWGCKPKDEYRCACGAIGETLLCWRMLVCPAVLGVL